MFAGLITGILPCILFSIFNLVLIGPAGYIELLNELLLRGGSLDIPLLNELVTVNALSLNELTNDFLFRIYLATGLGGLSYPLAF